MPNANTIAAFQNLSQGNVTSESAFASAAGGSVRAVLPPPAPGFTAVFEGHALRVRAVAKVTGGTTANYTLKVYGNYGGKTNLTTFTSDIYILTRGAGAGESAARVFR